MPRNTIYLTVAQIDALHDLAHSDHWQFGSIQSGVQIETDDAERSHVTLVASFTEHGSGRSDNSFAEINKDGLRTRWVR
jgi:hypothetical protein